MKRCLSSWAVAFVAALAIFSQSDRVLTADAYDLTNSDLADLRGGYNGKKCETPASCVGCVGSVCNGNTQAACEASSNINCPNGVHVDCFDGNALQHCEPVGNTHKCKEVRHCKWVAMPWGGGSCGPDMTASIATLAYTMCDTTP